MNLHSSSVAIGNVTTREHKFCGVFLFFFKQPHQCVVLSAVASVMCSTVRISPLTRPHFVSLSLFCRLALYVYEYLLHVGAQKSAQTFLSEVRHCFPSISRF